VAVAKVLILTPRPMSNPEKIIVLRRDVAASLIPSGAHLFLQRGSEVTLTQDLGGSFTVNIYGNLARIDRKDADALGFEVTDPVQQQGLEDAPLEDQVWAILRSCYDPEIPVNIVDLGLIYDCQLVPLGNNDFHIKVEMTLTAPGCGMGPILADDVKQRLVRLSDVSEVDVDIVFDPPWHQGLMSEAAKLQLGML